MAVAVSIQKICSILLTADFICREYMKTRTGHPSANRFIGLMTHFYAKNFHIWFFTLMPVCIKKRKGENTMRTKNMSILVFAIAGALLISGCEKQDAEDTPATVLDMSASSEAPIDVDVLSETVENVPTETSTTPVSEQTATTESTPQDTTSAGQKSDNASPATQKTDNASSTPQKTDNTTQTAPKMDNPAPTTQKSDNTTQTTQKSDLATPAATVDVAKAFHPNDGWTSNISFQMPGNWSYTIYEGEPDWGFVIQVNNQENASVDIYGQYGTLNVGDSYTDAPTDFETLSGMKGKFYQEKRTGEDGSSYVGGDILFDTDYSYDVRFSMPESVYNEYKDTLQAIFLSIKIENVFAE